MTVRGKGHQHTGNARRKDNLRSMILRKDNIESTKCLVDQICVFLKETTDIKEDPDSTFSKAFFKISFLYLLETTLNDKLAL